MAIAVLLLDRVRALWPRATLTTLALASALSATVAPPAVGKEVSFKRGEAFVSVSVLTGGSYVRRYRKDAHGDYVAREALYTGAEQNSEGGMCFNRSGDLYVMNGSRRTASKFTVNGVLLTSHWGSFADDLPQSCVVDRAGHVYVGSDRIPGTAPIRKFDPTGKELDRYTPKLGCCGGDRSADALELASNQCTLLYTAEGEGIMRFDVCRRQQRKDLSHNLPGPCASLRELPDGRVLVACKKKVLLLGRGGKIKHTYTPGGTKKVHGYFPAFFALNLDPDGNSFWTARHVSGLVAKVSIRSGKVLRSFAQPSSFEDYISGLGIFGEPVAGLRQP